MITQPGFTLALDIEKKKSGAKNSAFSKPKPKYCGRFKIAEVII
jgi:hypothetical protein